MKLPIPTSALLAFWLNAWNRDQITDSDLRNALESLTLMDLPIPSSMSYAIALPDRVILDRNHALATGPQGAWSYIEIDNTVGFPDLNFVRARFLETIEISASALQNLDLVGLRDDIDDALDQLEAMHLPAISPRNHATLGSAVRTLVTAELCLEKAQSMSSPSQDAARKAILLNVKSVCVDVILAVASTA